MGAMPTSPQISAALVAVSSTSLAVHLAIAPAPFAPSSAAVVAIGAVVFATLVVVGLVLVRGRWARLLGVAVEIAVLGIAATGRDFDGWALAAVVTALGGLGLLAGRWLDGWIRGRPSATGPDPKAVGLLLGLLGLVPVAGVASPGGLETSHGALGAAGVLLAWGLGKAQVWALWATRLVLPVVVLLAALVSPLLGGLLLLAWGAALTWLAWSREVGLAVQPLLEDLPGPRPTPGSRKVAE